MKRANSEEVRNIEDHISEYLSETLKVPSERRMLNCFVCGRQARGNNHNIKDCIQIAEVSRQVNRHLWYAKATKKPLNNCVRGFHTHQSYEELLECAMNGDGGFAMSKEFVRLEEKGATSCPQCGDVFPTHRSEHCPNYPYWVKGDKGFKAVYDARAMVIVERLRAVLDRIEGEETESDECPSCMVSDDHHDWRSCLKRMICQKNRDGDWEMQPPRDLQDLLEGYQVNPCENCCRVVPNHSLDNCPEPECSNYRVRFAIVRSARCVAQIKASRRGYLNGIIETEALCPVCNWFILRDVDGVVIYHNPESCLKSC